MVNIWSAVCDRKRGWLKAKLKCNSVRELGKKRDELKLCPRVNCCNRLKFSRRKRWLKSWPRCSFTSFGRCGRGWLKRLPKTRFVREEGMESTEPLKLCPRQRLTRSLDRLSTGRSKSLPRRKYRRPAGSRPSTGWLKPLPRLSCVRPRGRWCRGNRKRTDERMRAVKERGRLSILGGLAKPPHSLKYKSLFVNRPIYN